MKQGSIFTYDYHGKTYEFFPSRAARCAIQEMQLSAIGELKDPAALSAMMELQKLNAELKKSKQENDQKKVKELNQQISEMTMRAMGSMQDLTKLQDRSEDEYEIAKLLLMNTKSINGEVTEELADDILEAMECELGAEAFTRKLLEIYDKVFTMIAEVQDLKKDIQKRIKENSKPLPLT